MAQYSDVRPVIITAEHVLIFFLVFIRIVGVVLSAPIFSRKEFFLMGKVAFLFFLSGALFYVVPVPEELPVGPFMILLAMIAEFFIGFLIGFTMDLLISGIEFAGSIMDTQAGLSVASLLDPSSGRNMSLLALLLKYSATILFLVMDGHHLIIASVANSFKLIPICHVADFSQPVYTVLQFGTYIFFVGVQLSAPILLIIFMVDFGLGILNKVAEQINVFQLGFQVKPLVSLIIFLSVTPGFVSAINKILESISDDLMKLFYSFQGG